MEVIVQIADIKIALCSDFPILVDEPCADFVANGPEYDVKFRITGWAGVPCPSFPAIGRDLFLRYYEEGEIRCCERMNGPYGPSSRTWYTKDLQNNTCFLRDPQAQGMQKASVLLHLLPIRDVLSRFDSVLLHAAQVDFHGKGLLFTAPSGTGKTTQAALWNQWEHAAMISGDRTAVRCLSGQWKSYGFPADGSSRMWNATGLPLGAVVVLRQGNENEVRRLGAKEAFRLLLEQTVALHCDRGRMETTVDCVMKLAMEIPVYLLRCRPDRGAVDCLKEQLLKDGV